MVLGVGAEALLFVLDANVRIFHMMRWLRPGRA
jgi:hypothetical protein